MSKEAIKKGKIMGWLVALVIGIIVALVTMTVTGFQSGTILFAVLIGFVVFLILGTSTHVTINKQTKNK